MTDPDPRASAEEAVRAAEAEAERAEAHLAESLGQLRDHAGDALRDSGRIMRDSANARVSDAFDAAADEVDRAAASLHEAGARDGPEALRRPLSDVSGFLERTARDLRDTDLDEVARQVGAVARERPVTFMAGAAAIGFALGRIARAATTDAADRHAEEEADTARWPNAAHTPDPEGDAIPRHAEPAAGAPGAAETQAQPERAVPVTGGTTTGAGPGATAQGTGTAAGLRVEEGSTR